MPDATLDDDPSGFAAGESLRYQVQTFGSSPRELDPSIVGNFRAGLQIYNDVNISEDVELTPDGAEVNASATLELDPDASYEIYLFGAIAAEGTGSARGRLICYGATTSVTSLLPASGSALGGNNVVITGSGLAGVETVTFGGTVTTDITLDDDNQITVAVPPHAAGTVNVTVARRSGPQIAAGSYTYIAVPVVTSVSPDYAGLSGNVPVTIAGTGLANATSVTIGGAAVTGITSNTDTEIVGTAPSHAAGIVYAAVTNAGGTSAPNAGSQFTYFGAPTISGLSNAQGPAAGGTGVIISGTGFRDVSAVMFGSSAASFNEDNDNQITAVAPAGTGTVSVTVTAVGGTSSGRPYEYIAAPTVTGILPTSGPESGSPGIIISGNDLAGASVTFGGVAATVTGNTPNQITVTAPAHAAGAVTVEVTTPGGGPVSAGTYTYRAVPSVSGVSPDVGPLVGGGSVTIGGSGLADPTSVTFGGLAAPVTASSDTQITVTVPAGAAAAAVDVVVTTAGGTSSNGVGAYTYLPLPTVGSILPTSGPLSGGTLVTITGSGFTPDSTVAFGAEQAANVTFGGANTLTAETPAGFAGTVGVAVTTPGGTSGSASQFTYLVEPAANPSSATVAANSTSNAITLDITGTDVTAVAVAVNATHGNAVASGTSITYTPTAGYSGVDSFTYTATNAGGTSAPATVSITVTPPVLVLAPAAGALPDGLDGSAYSQSFTASGGTMAYSFTDNGALPSGLTLSPAGVLSGTPDTPGSSTFVITAKDMYDATGSATYTLTIDEQLPVANPVSLTVAIGSTNNPVTLDITGGAPASVAVVTQGTNGTATATGTSITYTPNAAYSGSDSFTYTATNSAGISSPATVSVTVTMPTITLSPAPGALPDATVDAAYSQQVTASGGNGSYTYAVTSGALPAGVNLSLGGLLSGTPTATGTASFAITATDSVTAFGSAGYTLQVVLPLPVVSDLPFTIAANSTATSVPLALSGGAASSVAVVANGAHGTATASGTGITYTPVAGSSGSDSFTYTATNASGTSAPATVTVTVTAPTLALSPAAGTLPPAMMGSAYSQTFVASNGTGPYTYVASGSVPAGLILDASTGALSGTPTVAGPYNLVVTATDLYGATGSSAYVLDVAVQPPVANPVTASVVRDTAGNPITLSITGGAASAVSVSTPPSNGSVNVSGTTITYTPTAGYTGADSFDYTATNASGTSAPATVSITVTQPVLALAPATGPLPDGTIDNAYSQALSASGGSAPYTFAVTGGSLPSGLAIAPGSNVIAGTPTLAGTFNFAVTATDAGGATGAVTYSMRIFPAALVLSPPTGSGLPPATTGTAYSFAGISATGGSGPASFAATGLPPGLSIAAASGVITGTPTAAGSYSPVVTATDAAGAVATATYALAVNAGAGTFVFTPDGGALPPAMVAEAYSQDISATGGVAPLIYSLAGGTLPSGLVLNISNGDLNGPLAADAAPGSYNFTIAVRDATGVTGSASFTLQVQPRAVTVANKEVTVEPGGTPPNVYLNAGATGGPFVDAILGTVSPPSAGTAEVIRGELAQAGPVAPTGFYLRFTPNPGFSGRAVVGYQLISASGTSNVGTVAYNLNFNAAAVADDIDGLVHDFVRTRQNLLSSTIRVPGLLERRRMENARDPVTIRMSPQETGMRAAFSTSLAQMEAARDRADGLDSAEPRPFNIWIDGAIRIHGGGDDDENDDRWGSFALLSVGMDYLLSDRALIGISAHFDRMTDPADEDAKLTGSGWFAGPYVSLEIAKGVFFDTSLLYGGSWNDIDTPFFDGKFDTSRWMWDGSIKGEWYLDEVTVVTPKLRAVYLTETVKDYAVGNDAGDRLLLEGFSMEQLRASIGAEVERRIVLSNGMVLTPRLGATVGVAGLDGQGTFATVTAGASLQTETAWMFDFALLFDIEGEGGVSVGARARMSTRF